MIINGFKVKMLTAKKCMSVDDLCKASQLSDYTVRRAMDGYGVTIRSLGKIAKALGVEPEDIVEQED